MEDWKQNGRFDVWRYGSIETAEIEAKRNNFLMYNVKCIMSVKIAKQFLIK